MHTVYVYMCTCMYICMYVCTYVCMYISMYMYTVLLSPVTFAQNFRQFHENEKPPEISKMLITSLSSLVLKMSCTARLCLFRCLYLPACLIIGTTNCQFPRVLLNICSCVLSHIILYLPGTRQFLPLA